MSNEPKLSARRPSRPSNLTAEAFKAGADKHREPVAYPWLDPAVLNDDAMKGINLLVTAEMKAKLVYIGKKGGGNQQKFMRDVLYPAIDAEIARLLDNKS